MSYKYALFCFAVSAANTQSRFCRKLSANFPYIFQLLNSAVKIYREMFVEILCWRSKQMRGARRASCRTFVSDKYLRQLTARGMSNSTFFIVFLTFRVMPRIHYRTYSQCVQEALVILRKQYKVNFAGKSQCFVGKVS